MPRIWESVGKKKKKKKKQPMGKVLQGKWNQ